MKTYESFIYSVNDYNLTYDCTRFDRLIESSNGVDGLLFPSSHISSIRRFYGATNPHNRSKIVEMINNNINNIHRVYNLVLDYEQVKSKYKEI